MLEETKETEDQEYEKSIKRIIRKLKERKNLLLEKDDEYKPPRETGPIAQQKMEPM